MDSQQEEARGASGPISRGIARRLAGVDRLFCYEGRDVVYGTDVRYHRA